MSCLAMCIERRPSICFVKSRFTYCNKPMSPLTKINLSALRNSSPLNTFKAHYKTTMSSKEGSTKSDRHALASLETNLNLSPRRLMRSSSPRHFRAVPREISSGSRRRSKSSGRSSTKAARQLDFSINNKPPHQTPSHSKSKVGIDPPTNTIKAAKEDSSTISSFALLTEVFGFILLAVITVFNIAYPLISVMVNRGAAKIMGGKKLVAELRGKLGIAFFIVIFCLNFTRGWLNGLKVKNTYASFIVMLARWVLSGYVLTPATLWLVKYLVYKHYVGLVSMLLVTLLL